MLKNNLSEDRSNKILRFLDRYIGIPLVFLLGFFKRKHIDTNINNISNLALLKTACIGDTLLIKAIIKDIKEKNPKIKIYLFVGSSNWEIANIIANSDIQVIKLPIKDPFSAIKIVRKYKFDVWIDFGSWPRLNAIISYFAKANLKIGFKTKNQYRHYVYDIYIEHSNKIHELFNYKNLLRSINLSGENLPYLQNKKDTKQKIVTIHMFPGGTKSYLKEWPKEYWIELINFFTQIGYEVFLTGGLKDREKALAVYNLCRQKEQVKVVAGEKNLREVIALLGQSFLVISVNTGLMHLAAALRCNLIALHGPTSSKRWGPLNPEAVVLQSPLPCSPCLNLGFEYACNQNRCMQAISVKQVKKAVYRFLRDKKLENSIS